MSEFFGTEFQIEIQKRMIARHKWIADEPSIANGGRVMNFLDPDAFGWNRVKEFVSEDGTVAITAMPQEGAVERLKNEFGKDYDFPCWNVHISAADQVLAFSRAIASGFVIPTGWRLECLMCPNEMELEAIQALNLATGVAPLPGPYLRGEVVPSFTSGLWASDGSLAATSNVTARYHPKSRFGGHVFNGSTSVARDHWGLGLGKVVTAHVLIESHRTVGWKHALAQVAPDNVPSQRMVEACGLSRDSSVVTFGVAPRGITFTR